MQHSARWRVLDINLSNEHQALPLVSRSPALNLNLRPQCLFQAMTVHLDMNTVHKRWVR